MVAMPYRCRNSPRSTKAGCRRSWARAEGRAARRRGVCAVAMTALEIEELICAGLPEAQVTVEDLAGDGNHYRAHVVATGFRGKSRVQQPQMVYQTLGE